MHADMFTSPSYVAFFRNAGCIPIDNPCRGGRRGESLCCLHLESGVASSVPPPESMKRAECLMVDSRSTFSSRRRAKSWHETRSDTRTCSRRSRCVSLVVFLFVCLFAVALSQGVAQQSFADSVERCEPRYGRVRCLVSLFFDSSAVLTLVPQDDTPALGTVAPAAAAAIGAAFDRLGSDEFMSFRFS
jgi:hypothetical protein